MAKYSTVWSKHIERDRESEQFAAEKKARISAAENALKEMKQQLAAKESEFSKLEQTAEAGLQKLQGHADRVNRLAEKFRSDYQKEVEAMQAIADDIESPSLELYSQRPLIVRFQKAELPHALKSDRTVVILAEGEQHSYNKPAPQPTPFVMPAPPTEQQRTEMSISHACFAIGQASTAKSRAETAIAEYRETGRVPNWLQSAVVGV